MKIVSNKGVMEWTLTTDPLRYHKSNKTVSLEEIEDNKRSIVTVINEYGIEVSKIEMEIGPSVTMFEIFLKGDVQISKIKRIEKDLECIGGYRLRIMTTNFGKISIIIEVPNRHLQIVSLRSIIESKSYQECNYELPIVLGKTISNEIFIADLSHMPHLMIAGAWGQGKTVLLNAIITSLLYKKHPRELKFVMVDLTAWELAPHYSKIEKYYLAEIPDIRQPIITDLFDAKAALSSLCVEMDERYKILAKASVRNVAEYNEKFKNGKLDPSKGYRYLPYIVLVINEFAYFILAFGKEAEFSIARLAQLARAVGIHMIISTTRPSTDVITGIIKANFPARVAMKVLSKAESKNIIDCTDAEKLLGKGDMFFTHNNTFERIQGAAIETTEVEAVIDSFSNHHEFSTAYYLPKPNITEPRDSLLKDVATFLCTQGIVSISSLQREFFIGYSRALRIMDQLESLGIVSASQGNKTRRLLVELSQLDDIL